MKKQGKHLILKALLLGLICLGGYVAFVPMKAPTRMVEKTLPNSVLKN